MGGNATHGRGALHSSAPATPRGILGLLDKVQLMN